MSSTNLTLSWDTAIKDAKREIDRAKDRISRLRSSIRIFEQRKKAGHPFPTVDDSTAPKNASTQN